MAAPTVPTLATLVAESLKKAGQTNPDATLTTRAESLWMEEIKNDILILAGGRKLKPLYVSATTVTVNGKNLYSCQTDYISDLTIEILDGTKRGTATGGASGSITLAKNEGDIVSKHVLVTAGTGVGSISQITAFNISTLVATVSPNFGTAPANGSTYMIIDATYPLKEKPIWEIKDNYSRGIPEFYYPLGDSDYGEFILDPTPYSSDSHVYGLRMRYYTNLMTLDLAGTLMITLYQRWRNVWIQGVCAKALDELNDTKANRALKEYRFALQQVVARDAYGLDMSNLQPTVEG